MDRLWLVCESDWKLSPQKNSVFILRLSSSTPWLNDSLVLAQGKGCGCTVEAKGRVGVGCYLQSEWETTGSAMLLQSITQSAYFSTDSGKPGKNCMLELGTGCDSQRVSKVFNYTSTATYVFFSFRIYLSNHLSFADRFILKKKS